MGRRILAIALLIAFASPLVAPLLAATADPQASLPLCCRSHGAHRCVMMHISGVSGGPAFQAPPCPFYPAPATPVRTATASLGAALPPSVQAHQYPAPRAPNPRHAARIFLASANLKRGPPTLLA